MHTAKLSRDEKSRKMSQIRILRVLSIVWLCHGVLNGILKSMVLVCSWPAFYYHNHCSITVYCGNLSNPLMRMRDLRRDTGSKSACSTSSSSSSSHSSSSISSWPSSSLRFRRKETKRCQTAPWIKTR